MSNIFINLPAPAGNGSGAAVDMTDFGGTKTITVVGNGGAFEPFVTIEVSNDAGGTKWAPLWLFQLPGDKVFVVACKWMRATVSNHKGGGAPTVEVGGDDSATTLASLAVTAGNGTAASTDTTDLPGLKTVHVGGSFRGNLNIEVSEDGGTTFAQSMSFSAPGIQTAVFTAGFMRVTRNGVPVTNPGLPLVNVAACEAGGGGGGGGNPQRFQYLVLGTEPVLSELVIPLPDVRDDALYLVQISQATASFGLHPNVANASRTTTQFTLSLSGDATAGDIFTFFVDDPT